MALSSPSLISSPVVLTTTLAPNSIRLREYQEKATESIFSYFDEGNTGNPLVALPTGTGKSIVIAEFIRRVFMAFPNQRIMKLTHVKELIDQNYKTLRRIWPMAPAGIYSSGLKKRETHFPITFAGIASVIKCPELFGHIDLVLIDEAHLVSPKEGTMYQTFINKLKEVNPLVKVIGFTATHYRLGQGLLTETGGIFTDVCFDLTSMTAFNWLVAEGYICPLIPRATKNELNVDSVQIHAGEYVQKQLQEAVDKAELTHGALRETLELASDRKHWLVFAAGVDHALHVRDALIDMGIDATCVHSRMSDAERDESIAGFKSGKYKAMVNNGILTTGFDFPEIDLIVMLRPTHSSGLWVQMLGRGTRPVYAPGYNLETRDGRLAAQQAGPKKQCLVLDFAGNTRRLGPINDPVLPRKKGSGGGGQAPVKVCEVCGIYNHASVRFCTNCGSEFLRNVKLAIQASTEALIADGLPQVVEFKVDRIVYQIHKKISRPDSIKVSYYCGLRMFEEFICLEHEGYARKLARDWWRNRTQLEPPDDTAAAMALMNNMPQEFKVPRRIKVWINKKYPEIRGYDFETVKT
jgi:DNA repair protein RadD